ncbi:hypothetical protein LSTR_LSTR006052 [Laodelphax striatellus]|uniref:Uncharacterized protein n=1 Tax=Laodelphax striatellus TaxID=195883 RepID=A0A482XQS5_LAOST|nr:hypothetical protein LSTR_LSTR006052 [Laodelphax striatellus]
MNPQQPNLLSLRDDIVRFQKQFSLMKNAANPNFPRLECHQCPLAGSSVIVSASPSVTLAEFEYHLINHQQISTRNFHVHCRLCDKFLYVKNNLSACKNSLIGHLESSTHKNKYESMVNNHRYNMASKLIEIQKKFEELDVTLNDVVGKFNQIIGPPQTVRNDPPPQTVRNEPPPPPPVTYHKNSSITCNACQCTASTANDDQTIIENVRIHLQGSRHSSNIGGNKSLWCCFCQCKIMISEDEEISIYNLEQHIYGRVHQGDSSSSETEYSY